MKKILIIFGTRPEAIKLAPLIKELEQNSMFSISTCITAQHREMLDQVLTQYGIDVDYDLDIMKPKQSLTDITARCIKKIDMVIRDLKPDLIIVHGDTTTTLCGAIVAFYNGIKIAHVEAGLRTDNVRTPFPEEFNRRVVSLISDLDFAPTKLSYENLSKEGKRDNIYITGNTAIDALHITYDSKYQHDFLAWAEGKKLILLTCHRRENWGQPMANVFFAVKKLLSDRDDIKFLYPIHKNPIIRNLANEYFSDQKNIKIVEPMDSYDFQNIMARCTLILTDSGGLQEEAPSFGVPVLVLRNTTERPEGISAGTLKLVGTDPLKIYDSVTQLLDDKEIYKQMSEKKNPYGDGTASKKINKILSEFWENDDDN